MTEAFDPAEYKSFSISSRNHQICTASCCSDLDKELLKQKLENHAWVTCTNCHLHKTEGYRARNGGLKRGPAHVCDKNKPCVSTFILEII